MLAPHRPVVEFHRAIDQAQVVQRKAWRRVRFRGRCRRLESREQVVDVVAAVRQPGQPQPRPLDIDGLDHWRQPCQRAQIGVDVHALDAELRLAAVGASGRTDLQALDRQRQCPGREGDATDADRAPEQCREPLFGLPFHQRRYGEPGHGPERQQCRDRDGQPAHIARSAGGCCRRAGRSIGHAPIVPQPWRCGNRRSSLRHNRARPEWLGPLVNDVFLMLGIESWKPVLSSLLLPPVPLLLLILIGARMMVWRRGWGWLAVLAATAGLWFGACSAVGEWLQQALLAPPPALDAVHVADLKRDVTHRAVVAIVVLGGGREAQCARVRCRQPEPAGARALALSGSGSAARPARR